MCTKIAANVGNTSLLLFDWGEGEGEGDNVQVSFNDSYGEMVSYDWMLGSYLLVGFSTGILALVSVDGGKKVDFQRLVHRKCTFVCANVEFIFCP